MTFANASDGWVAVPVYGSSAHKTVILGTTDGGETWAVVDQASPVQFMEFTGSETGWGLSAIDGPNILYRTLDGGKTWIPADMTPSAATTTGSTSRASLSFGLPAVFGTTDIVAARAGGTKSTTTMIGVSYDSGITWHFEKAPFEAPSCASSGLCPSALPFSAADRSDWYYWSGVDLYSTTDAGRRWMKRLPNLAFETTTPSPIAVSPGSVFPFPSAPVDFQADRSGLAIANSASEGLILKSANGGRTFDVAPSPGGPDAPSIPGLPGITKPGTVISG
jgi:photosystem II stability/assembly factor-like uncharacterized protein